MSAAAPVAIAAFLVVLLVALAVAGYVLHAKRAKNRSHTSASPGGLTIGAARLGSGTREDTADTPDAPEDAKEDAAEDAKEDRRRTPDPLLSPLVDTHAADNDWWESAALGLALPVAVGITFKQVVAMGGMLLEGVAPDVIWELRKTIWNKTIGRIWKKLGYGAVMDGTKRVLKRTLSRGIQSIVKLAVNSIHKRVAIMVAKFAAKLSFKISWGPVGWAAMAIDVTIGLIDLWDPGMHNEKEGLTEFRTARRLPEAQEQLVYELNGMVWPEIIPLSLLFGAEVERARSDTMSQITNDYVESALERFRRQSSADAESNNALLICLDTEVSAEGEGPTEAERDAAYERFDADVTAYEAQLGARPDHLFHTFLLRNIRSANDEAADLRARAPFWYFAMCMPASYTPTASGGDKIAPDAKGPEYTHATAGDIRVAAERSQHGETFIEIVRAKVPHREERVRAYRLAKGDIRDLADARLPVLPDMQLVRARKAGYQRLRFNPVPLAGAISEAKSRPFRWRDTGKPDTEALDVPEDYHSLWLTSVLFQAFLVELARHAGVMASVPGGSCPSAADAANAGGDPSCSETRCVRLRSVFLYRGGVYMAPMPRPWHEERFVQAPVPPRSPTSSAWTPGTQLNEDAVHHWNEVHHNLVAIGSVLADLTDGSPMGLYVAMWSVTYPSYNTSELATVDATLISEAGLVERVRYADGRIHFEMRTSSRRVQALPRTEAAGLDLVALREAFNCDVLSTSILSLPGTGTAMDPLQLYWMKLDETEVAFCNANVRSLNAWLDNGKAVIADGSNVEGAKRVYVDGDKDVDFAIDIAFKVPVLEVRFAMEAGPPDEGAERCLVPGVAQKLAVARYSVMVEDVPMHFANYDGSVRPTYKPVETVCSSSFPQARLFANSKMHQACTGGVMNDDSIFRVGSSDGERNAGRGFHLNYTGPTPISEHHSPHLSLGDSKLHPSVGAFWSWDMDSRNCVVTDAARMQKFCLAYKKMDYDAGHGDCKVGWFQGLLEFFTGTTFIRGIRSKGDNPFDFLFGFTPLGFILQGAGAM